MKITRLETELYIAPPPERPITDALRANKHPGRVTLKVHTDKGLVGTSSFGFSSIRGANQTFQTMLNEEVAPLLEGQNPLAIRLIQEDLKRALEEQAIHGMTMYALASVDIALWDIFGQETGQPAHRLIGQAKDRIPAYTMVGWMHFDVDELKEVCARAVAEGFKAVKVKVGSPTLGEDIRRLEAVRAEVGPEVIIMVDANQTLSVFEALRRGQVFQEMGVFWFEEPLPARNYDDYAELAHGLVIPIATGENLYGKEEFKELLVRRGIDIVQVDLARLGGFSECVATGLTAAAFGVPCCTHGGGLIKLNILCALPNAMYLETGLLTDEDRDHFVDGCFLAPEGPGFSW
ncbi:MAG: mandelate racemase/muconate lactonizing enzyme family protein [Candidatus Poribacteria bacterium]|nr:mandelate racemase/muconate lactonizing enzyme family protein [Candidatus Poribacteria bacterium]